MPVSPFRFPHLTILQGRGAQIYAAKVEPILLAAGCELEVIRTLSNFKVNQAINLLSDTTRHRHALELAQKIELKYDAVLTVSGDGLIHEVLNGVAQHAQPPRALSIPIVPIPTGSGNGLAHNLLGLKVKPLFSLPLFAYTEALRMVLTLE